MIYLLSKIFITRNFVPTVIFSSWAARASRASGLDKKANRFHKKIENNVSSKMSDQKVCREIFLISFLGENS